MTAVGDRAFLERTSESHLVDFNKHFHHGAMNEHEHEHMMPCDCIYDKASRSYVPAAAHPRLTVAVQAAVR